MNQADSVTVLLVEDDPVDGALFKALLGHTKSFVQLHAETMRAARDAMAAQDVDAVLLDLSLPDSSTEESLTAIGSLASTCPVIVLTGEDDEELALRALSAGAQDYLVKNDVTEALLAKAVRYAVERYGTADLRTRQGDRLAEIFTSGTAEGEPLLIESQPLAYAELLGRFDELLESVLAEGPDGATKGAASEVAGLVSQLADVNCSPADLGTMYLQATESRGSEGRSPGGDEVARLFFLRTLVELTNEYRRRSSR